ncbi:unnamed protein product [Effrenium voratum]|nr:unnamed protein product [Effrenium voratum]
MRLAVLAVPGLWLARGDSESCELSESLFGAIPREDDEWLRWVAARPNQPAAALRAAEVLRGPATEQSMQEAWREVETIQLDGCESAELVGWFRFRYFQWLPKTDLSALEQQLRQCSGSALEVAAGLLLSRDGTQTPEALKLLAEAGPSLRLALALHSSGEKSAVASLTPRAQQELKLSEEGRDFDELLLATFGFWLAGRSTCRWIQMGRCRRPSAAPAAAPWRSRLVLCLHAGRAALPALSADLPLAAGPPLPAVQLPPQVGAVCAPAERR